MYIKYEEIRRMSDSIREMCGDDEDTFLDTLDGETDAMDILGKLIQQDQELKVQEKACRELAVEYLKRSSKLSDRKDATRQVMLQLLEAMGQKKVPHALATVSITKPRWSVEITDEAQVPSQLKITTTKPDIQAIKKILDAGEPVPGARPKVGNQSINVRLK
jgi:hypothetical protein